MSRVDIKYIEELRGLQSDGDEEKAHVEADKILCELLTELTYVEVVGEYKKIRKWYS